MVALDGVFREEWGRVLATLIGVLGDFDLAEDAAQEAFAIAADRWPRDGVPDNPRAWLMRTARNRATDRIRRDRALAPKLGLLAAADRVEGPMDATAEAIWLGGALTGMLADDPEVRGLLAMMLLHDSRRETRFDDGELVLLADQDPSRWDAAQIERGRAELGRAIALGGRGPYVLQAAIASLHAEAPCDWARIAALYGELGRLTGSPVVELNRAIAIAVAETDGPGAGLRIVDALGLDDFRYLHSTRAELLRRLGPADEARDAYRRARELTGDGAERRFLERRLTELG